MSTAEIAAEGGSSRKSMREVASCTMGTGTGTGAGGGADAGVNCCCCCWTLLLRLVVAFFVAATGSLKELGGGSSEAMNFLCSYLSRIYRSTVLVESPSVGFRTLEGIFAS